MLEQCFKAAHFETYTFPFSDGGDGFLDSIQALYSTKKVEVETLNPLRRKINSYYLLHDNQAYLEVASTAGIHLLKSHEVDLRNTTAYGVGEQIKDALNQGVKKLYIGLGGTATHELGLSVIQALGAVFITNQGIYEDYITSSSLQDIVSVDFNSLVNKEINVTLLTDVTSNLLGENGAAKVFSKQKGADTLYEDYLEDQGKRFLRLFQSTDISGYGAAGGMALALGQIFNVSIQSGAQFIVSQPSFIRELQACDVLITGEGKLDAQTALGKAPFVLSQCAAHYGLERIGIFGSIEANAHPFLSRSYALTDYVTLNEAMTRPESALKRVAQAVIHDLNNRT